MSPSSYTALYVFLDIRLSTFSIFDMSKNVQNVSYPRQGSSDASTMKKQSLSTAYKSFDYETISNTITGFENDLRDKLEELDREADVQAKKIELNQYLGYVAQLVDLFKHSVITPELQRQNDSHKDTQCRQQQPRRLYNNRSIDDETEQIIITKGLTKEQWNCLRYMTLNMNDILKLTKVSKKHLRKVYEKGLCFLEDDERDAVIALINAIEKHTFNDCSTEK